MFEKLNIFSKAAGLAQHAALRQSVIAQNVANADTPGYRAQDVKPFADVFQPGEAAHMRHTRAGHLDLGVATTPDDRPHTVYRPGAMSPNGNSVTLEAEMMASAEAKRDHDLALAVYKTSLGVMRSALGRR
ncbi:FlgB family protein [Aliiroseovarius sp. 2305UL8-7]|uniref:FlgB family protein n=1 Tax=Aliiroseovarius conchicola TaxID=3121637 RepID=UPI003527CB82